MLTYVYEGLDPTGNLESEVQTSKVFPLIRELKFKYNLSVTSMVAAWSNQSDAGEAFTLARSDGLNIGYVFADIIKNYDGGADTIEYCYYSPFYSKDRGRDNRDRKTLRSKKVSSLMATLNKTNAITNVNALNVSANFRPYEMCVDSVKASVGGYYRQTQLNSYEEELVLSVALGTKQLGDIPPDQRIKFMEAYEKLTKATEQQTKQEAEADRFFKQAWALHYSGGDSIVVGVISNIKQTERPNMIVPRFEQLVPLRRILISDLAQSFPELAGYMTMLKVHNEGNRNAPLLGDLIPRDDGYNPVLDIVISNYNPPNGIEGSWLFTPCSQI